MEENKENVVEETTPKTESKPEVKDQGVTKVKVKNMKGLKKDPSVVKVDLNAKTEETKEEVEEVKEETPALEEITDEKVEEAKEKLEEVVEETAKEVEKEIIKAEETGKPLPENIQKLVDFMDQTGGTLEDYVTLNKDYSKLDDDTVLREHYKKSKPHLTNEEINFLISDKFSVNEDTDEEIDIKRKKLALKEQVADARKALDGYKSKYYAEIKAGSKLTKEQQEAISFYNGYQQESLKQKQEGEAAKSTFFNRTNKFFGDGFKGFEYNVGDKKFRFNVKNVDKVKEAQSDISNFVGKYLDKNNHISDAEGYHKSLYTAMNPDAIANHFYEQGKADALKESIQKSKNINMDPRGSHDGNVKPQGVQYKVLGDDSASLKFKIKNNK
tara:strand:- start:1530 stop:2684 length:1155 start_codon:yes stop_codon:yes gene_type:complete